jgi:hypothetical protein
LKLEDEIVRQAIPKLEELIKELATIHGWKTAKEVKILLMKPSESLQEFEIFLKENFAGNGIGGSRP